MAEMNFKKWNTIIGWAVFAIAITTYTLTVEPTTSYWDCGEYIATSANLEVGHPPGAPLFQMIGAALATFAVSADKIAVMINMMSAFSSAFTILFMFWSLTLIMKKIYLKEEHEENKQNAVMVLGSAAVASLAFSFTDSFWFNAVEAEVYAMGSLFIALLLWLGLRWEQDMLLPKGNKWLLVISLVIGLSFGVHFLALLTIPAIGMIYFFKHYEKVTAKNFIIANVVIVAILFFIFKFLLPYTLGFFGKIEIFMVNSIGLPFNSGTIVAFLIIIVAFYFGLKYTRDKGFIMANTLVLCILFILIGFSTWFMLPIRANANPPINENKPSDAAEVLAYYNREQYGEQKTFYGPQFSDRYAGLDEDNPNIDGKPNYERDYKTKKYVIVNNYKGSVQNTDDKHKTFLPRMGSSDHAVNYMKFTDPLEFRIKPEYASEKELINAVSQFRTAYNSGRLDMEDYDQFLKGYSEYLIIEKPTFANNLKFMVEFQFGYMFWRYLMWNFTGKQNDLQGKYGNQDGNWLSGINAIDSIRLGNQSELSPDMQNNKGRNKYYFLPFILGVIGMIFHAKKDLKSFYVILILFLFTGLALKVFLNERPFEVRERDYALVGAFYAFAMWIAFGVYSIYDGIKKFVQPAIAVPIVLVVSMLAAPVLLAKENWDDHDRSGKYTTLASAKAYLDSCEPNAILFTIGDNDTFPLWYAQEIEGYRTDVRIVCTTLFNTDWYIDQMQRKAYTSEPVPMSLKRDQYKGSNRDYMFFVDRFKDTITLDQLMKFTAREDQVAKVELRNNTWVNFYPTRNIEIPINKENIIKNKVVSPKYYDSIVSKMHLKLPKDALYKARIMMLDIINENNWKRPIYFSGGSFSDEDYIFMKEYLQLDGVCFKLVPVSTPLKKDSSSPLDMGYVDSEKMYNIVKKWDWGNSNSSTIYHDPETRKNSITYRTNLARLMETLIKEGKNKKAEEIIDLAMDKMPIKYFEFYTLVEPFAQGYYEIGKPNKARIILSELIQKYQEELMYYKSLTLEEQYENNMEIMGAIEKYRSIILSSKRADDMKFYNEQKVKFNSYNKIFSHFKREME